MNTVKLGDICQFKRGLTYKKGDEVAISKNIVLRANNIDLASFKLNFDELKYISESIDIPEAKYVKKDTILICTASGSKSHLGKVALIDDNYEYAFGGFMGLLIPNARIIDARYLYWVLISKPFRDLIESLTDGANINNLKFSLIEDFEFPLPSLEEQWRIVAWLDAAFEKIDRAIELTKRNGERSGNIFFSKSNDIFAINSAEYSSSTLGEVLNIARGGSPRPIKDYLTGSEEGINWIKIGDVKPGAKYITETKQKIRKEGLSKTRLVKPGDFLLSNSMSFGRPYILEISGAIHDGWLVLSDKTDGLSKDYLYHFLSSDYVYKQFDKFAAGSTVRNLNTQSVAKVTIHYPKSRKKQDEIAHFLDKLQTDTRSLQQLYNRKIVLLDALKQSLLTQAFSQDEVK